MDPEFRPSPLAVAVVSLLHAEPLHPYAIQRLLKHWGKDRVINVGQRASLYKTIKRLHEAGLIAVLHTERGRQYPERTVYELTPAGRQATRAWLGDMIAVPRNEFPQFPAALSFLMMLAPEEALGLFEARADRLRGRFAAVDAHLQAAGLPRVVLMDDEYDRARLAAEIDWVDCVIADLRTGRLTWSLDELRQLAAAYMPDGVTETHDAARPTPG